MAAMPQGQVRRRRPLLAALLSLPMPGLGHLYAGDPVHALSMALGAPAVLAILGLSGVLSTFYGLAALLAGALGLVLYAPISAYLRARARRDYRLRPFNRWYWYLAFYGAAVALSTLLLDHRGTWLGYATYRVPAGSMAPTLQSGDLIVVDTRYAVPAPGDVVVFRSPVDPSLVYVKRIVAIGGDRVAIVGGEVLRNGVAEAGLQVPVAQRTTPFAIGMAPRRVPAGEVFVLGDARDNSADSRLWGTVPLGNIDGLVTYIYLSGDLERIGRRVR